MRKIIVGVLVLASVVVTQPLFAADKEWTGTNSTSWSDGGNWAPSGVPDAADNVFIRNNGTVSQSDGDFFVNNEIVGDAGGFGTFNQSGDGYYEVNNDLIVGNNTYSASPARGTYNLSSSRGLYVGRDVYVGNEGGTGAFVLQGSSLDIYNNLEIGTNSVSGLGTAVQSSGKFTQDGGTATIGSLFFLGKYANTTGTYELNSGNLSVGSWANVGESGTGYFDQKDGTFTIGGSLGLYVGSKNGSLGTYDMSGGGLETDNTVIGNQPGSAGTFNQSGGTHVVGTALTIANQPGSSGLYDMNGGTLQAGRIINNDRFTVHDAGTIAQPITISGDIENNKAFTFHNAIVKVDNNFEVTPSGYVVGTLEGGGGAKLIVGGDFISSSTQAEQWNTRNAQLEFTNSAHQVMFSGIDSGAYESGLDENFAWGDVNFGGGSFSFLPQEDLRNGALYVGTITPNSFSWSGDSKITGFSGESNIYYLTQANGEPLNEWLGGQTYQFATGGGAVLPMGVVPEPISSVLFLLGAGVFGAAARKRRRA